MSIPIVIITHAILPLREGSSQFFSKGVFVSHSPRTSFSDPVERSLTDTQFFHGGGGGDFFITPFLQDALLVWVDLGFSAGIFSLRPGDCYAFTLPV